MQDLLMERVLLLIRLKSGDQMPPAPLVLSGLHLGRYLKVVYCRFLSRSILAEKKPGEFVLDIYSMFSSFVLPI